MRHEETFALVIRKKLEVNSYNLEIKFCQLKKLASLFLPKHLSPDERCQLFQKRIIPSPVKKKCTLEVNCFFFFQIFFFKKSETHLLPHFRSVNPFNVYQHQMIHTSIFLKLKYHHLVNLSVFFLESFSESFPGPVRFLFLLLSHHPKWQNSFFGLLQEIGGTLETDSTVVERKPSEFLVA